MYLVEAAKNLIQPDSDRISNKETIKCKKNKFIIESFYFLCCKKACIFVTDPFI